VLVCGLLESDFVTLAVLTSGRCYHQWQYLAFGRGRGKRRTLRRQRPGVEAEWLLGAGFGEKEKACVKLSANVPINTKQGKARHTCRDQHR
jgi:hypothetical protein